MYFSDFARRPVDELNPCGVNPNNLEEFEEIKRQINNINKVTGRVSWKKVQQLSKAILKSESKDLRCGCYYTVAAAHNDGLNGFVDGLNAIYDLCVVYWSSSFPEVSKTSARVGAFEWLVEHAEKRVKQFNISADDRVVLEAGHRICLRIEEELRLHYGHKAPSLGGVRRLFGQYIDELKEQEERQQEASQRKKKESNPSTQAMMSGGISVNVKPPNSVAQQPKADQSNEKNYSVLISVAAVTLLFIFALSAYYIDKHQRLNDYQQKIESAEASVLLNVTKLLRLEDSQTLGSLKEPLISTVDTLVSELETSPEKIGQIDRLTLITANLSQLYPDSSSIQVLSSEIDRVKAKLETDFNLVSHKFSRARTAIANLKSNAERPNIELAYQYSNSLFPLLGRIEYAEKTNNRDELDRALVLLNVYLYKIEQLKASQDNESPTKEAVVK
ncbi:type VI secretion system ImpA family N-terminal domain-containing protein [Vibrio ostreicida]|uniref:type VI secretion system ImpA family N-terminal domain-containing protein n=1 Tax=Vibrio ostreicida TaxID=526588 RepID=UPI000970F708|nr:type VI secretion system ImpA family N-terminal domain-containing protein [Vibrio ostreicida]